ncbi:hypothetical protein L5515_002831 [Caenorhabditis briggsae]|uniref:Uncharacterized protein n=1 Tax=Caenorhabditis briggsae TaxID=6238 RepID=A0AAE9J1K9_CAEBR|nr:hypothetical protein L3Y34_016750 [Caenorhabditis briggsae]UMM15434.1 hypothetical protein L5515_002831 [Caenorhabditis briggsae]
MAPLKVYVASATANPETKYRVQRTLMILDGLGIPFDSIDITKPEHAEQRRFMREKASKKGPNGAVLPPQFFYEDEYLGDYEDFDTSVEADTITEFLRLLPDAIESNVITDSTATQGENTDGTTAKSNEKLEKTEVDEEDEEDEEWDEDEGEDEEEEEDVKKDGGKKNEDEDVDASETITLAKPTSAKEENEKKEEEEEVDDEELEGEDEEWGEEEEEEEEEA